MAGEFKNCRACHGTGVVSQDEEFRALYCPNCERMYGSYMVKRETWADAGLGPRHFMCLDCLQTKLGRKLTPADFNLQLSINDGIRLGIEMGRKE